MAAATFLIVNGFDLDASEREMVEVFWRLADRPLAEDELATWFRRVARREG